MRGIVAVAGVALVLAGVGTGRTGRADEAGADLVVDASGRGHARTIQAALDTLSKGRRERTVILIRDGVYREKVRVDAACVTLRGQSRQGTRIEFPQRLVDFERAPDRIGRAVVNVHGDDVVIENLTVANTADVRGPQAAAAGTFGRHAFTVYGRGDRTVLLDCDLLSEGADTVALWQGDRGRYYHARCHFRGGVDFLCPRGWCYVTDCTFFETRPTAALWHDGSHARGQKLVVRSSRFDGVDGWWLGRHHRDAQFYLLDCTFSATMADRPVGLHRYDDPAKDRAVRASVRWGERSYFFNCHRDGGDYAWHRDNLAAAESAPTPGAVTASWTFGGTWDPERTDGPAVTGVEARGGTVRVTFGEEVTVKGAPKLRGAAGPEALYQGGSGSRTLTFRSPGAPAGPFALASGGGLILASAAAARPRAVGPGPLSVRTHESGGGSR